MNSDFIATGCLAAAVTHTFAVGAIRRIERRFPKRSLARRIFHVLSEVELVFAFWALLYLVLLLLIGGAPLTYLRGLDFTEPVFVFVAMTLCSTRPILLMASRAVSAASAWMPLPRPMAAYGVTLMLGPLLGSLITEPAAMTVTALILRERFFGRGLSTSFMYATMALLFVNVSIGGTLTPFAAPPVLMVASRWNWDLQFMLTHFGDKAILACALSTAAVMFIYRRELLSLKIDRQERAGPHLSVAVSLVHTLLLAAVVVAAHHVAWLVGLFLMLLALWHRTRLQQEPLRWQTALLVSAFLAGIVSLGPPQRWWLEPLLRQFDALALYVGAIGLTAFTDNAALTFLGAQVPDLSEGARYALVAGAVVGGGLTVIANAPNPAGWGLLESSFGPEGIRPFRFFRFALGPTLIAALCFWLL